MPALVYGHRAHGAGGYSHDQSALSPCHFHVRAHLFGVVLKRLWRWVDIALPVNDNLRRSVGPERDRIGDSCRHKLGVLRRFVCVDRNLRNQSWPQSRNLRNRQ